MAVTIAPLGGAGPASRERRADGEKGRGAGAPLDGVAHGYLSPREREVLTYVAAGCTRQQTAHRMKISTSTVATYLARLRSKLSAPTQAHLIRAAVELGL
ncbi:helix-turn-helix transcriptional regulator [Streptomyces sp. NPDC006251]|uniref:response regulator transcription factor n=1 Tax=Streptomyces sp. NPDC006251 TaxID=3155718 RepID=UPI0033BC0BBB